MCDTKRKIADGLKKLMNEKSIRKITVQDIMDCKEMKRQSFYYHFQDIYDVVDWICKKELLEKIRYTPEETFEEWIYKVIRLIKEDLSFYRKVTGHIEREKLIGGLSGVVEEQLTARGTLKNNEGSMVMRFAIRSICHFILDSITQMKELDDQQVAETARFIDEVLIMDQARFFVLPGKMAGGSERVLYKKQVVSKPGKKIEQSSKIV